MIHQLFLLRHGLSTANRDGIVQGQTDYPLAEEGIHQSRLLAQFWSARGLSFDKIISSPLQRARATAEILAQTLENELVFDDIWMEHQLGAAQGENYEKVRSWYADRSPPSPYDPVFENGESALDLFLRSAAAVQGVLLLPAGKYLIVSHGALLSSALQAILGLAPATGRGRPLRFLMDNTGFAECAYDREEARWTIVRINATPHLPYKVSLP